MLLKLKMINKKEERNSSADIEQKIKLYKIKNAYKSMKHKHSSLKLSYPKKVH